MRDLLAFLARYSSFFIFLFLEVVCLVLIVNNHPYQRTRFLNSSNTVTASLLQARQNFTSYLYLKQENAILKEKNEELLAKQAQMYRASQAERDTLCSPSMDQVYSFIAADVISNSVTRVNNFIVLNRGRNDGVEREMGVIGPNGVVGIVTDVTDNFATVMSVLHGDCNISVQLNRVGHIGSLKWSGGDPGKAQVNGIPQHVPVQEGDTVSTSWISKIFPEEIMVGTVSYISKPSGGNFYDIEITLSTSFGTLRHGYVVNYLYKEELESLEAKQEP